MDENSALWQVLDRSKFENRPAPKIVEEPEPSRPIRYVLWGLVGLVLAVMGN